MVLGISIKFRLELLNCFLHQFLIKSNLQFGKPIGGVVAGLLATYYGVSVAWAVGGFMGIILVALIALIAPSFRKLQI